MFSFGTPANHICLLSDNKFTSIGPIYYEYGSMVITYEDASKAVRALYALREAKYEDKHLLGESLCISVDTFESVNRYKT